MTLKDNFKKMVVNKKESHPEGLGSNLTTADIENVMKKRRINPIQAKNTMTRQEKLTMINKDMKPMMRGNKTTTSSLAHK